MCITGYRNAGTYRIRATAVARATRVVTVTSSMSPVRLAYPSVVVPRRSATRSIRTRAETTAGWARIPASIARASAGRERGSTGVPTYWWNTDPSFTPASNTARSRSLHRKNLASGSRAADTQGTSEDVRDDAQEQEGEDDRLERRPGRQEQVGKERDDPEDRRREGHRDPEGVGDLRVRHVGDHEDGGRDRDEQDGDIRLERGGDVVPGRSEEDHERDHEERVRRGREPEEGLLRVVHLHEPREAEDPERREPRGGDDRERAHRIVPRALPPGPVVEEAVHEEGGGDAEADRVAEAVEIAAPVVLRAEPAGREPVEAVEDDARDDEGGRLEPPPVDHVRDRDEAHHRVHDRDDVRDRDLTDPAPVHPAPPRSWTSPPAHGPPPRPSAGTPAAGRGRPATRTARDRCAGPS